MVLQDRLLYPIIAAIVSGLILPAANAQHDTGLDEIDEDKTNMHANRTLNSISGHVRLDLQATTRSDANPGLTDWNVLLLDQSSRPLYRTNSDKNGQFTFKGLPSGNYYVAINRARGYQPTFDADGLQSKDFVAVHIPSNSTKRSVNFKYTGTGAIDSYIWHDTNLNYIRDEGESGWEGIQVILKHSEKDIVRTSTTDSDGNYRFEHLPPGRYDISVKEPEGFDPNSDEDGLQTPNQSTIKLAPGVVHKTADFGYIKEDMQESVPVKWESFQVRNVSDKQVALQWMTSDVTHCDYFEIERSTDQKNWSVIATVQPDGPAEKRTMYSYVDTEMPCKTVFYRVHQVDFNRSRGATNPHKVRIDCEQRLHSYPNPATSNVTVTIPTNLSPEVLSVFAPDGSLQVKKVIPKTRKDVYTLSIDVEDWAEGMYYLTLHDRKDKVIGQKTFTVHR